jgi:hypothetical protein
VPGAFARELTTFSIYDEKAADVSSSRNGGKATDAALQAAQAELIRTPHFSHPHYWAAFQLNGDWSQGN